jgi:hypothetical protein
MQIKPIYALSIKQPWAWLICKGFKDVENRDWFIGREPAPGFHQMNHKIELPARIYVHASKTQTGKQAEEAVDFITERGMLDKLAGELSDHFLSPVFGAIIGEVTITGCVDKSDSPWFVGKYGFILVDPVLYQKPIPCRGQLGFFKAEVPNA